MYKDLKVTSGEVAANNVKSAPDRLQGTATENKNIFDKLVELFVGKYNDLLDELDDNEIKAIDPITINGYTISHANSGVTQGMYGTDQEQDPQHGEKFIVPYFITDEHGHIVSAGNSEVQLPSGGGGGTDNYNDLSNKPSINSVTLSGNKSASDLSLASAVHTHTKSDITDFPSLATVATTGDYDDLSDKPTIPTKVSDLNNDSGFISSETDPVYSASAASGITSSDITAWNGKSTVSLNRKTTSGTNIADLTINGTTTQLYAPTSGGGGTITEVKTTAGTHQTIDVTSGTAQFAVPTDTNHLTNGAGFISTETDPVFSASAASGITSSDISAWNGKSDFSGDYDDLTNKPTIPTKTSDLNNDSGFVSGLVAEEKSIKDNVSVNGSGTTYTDGNASIAKTGYTPLGVVGFRVINASSSGANGANVVISHAYISGTTAYFRVKNTASSAAKVRVYFTILYAKA